MKRITGMFVAGATLLFAGCGGSIKSIDISQSAPVAVVSFSLNNSIHEEGKERNSGPGLLQKAVDYYKNHQIAVNQLWTDFKAQYRDILLGTEVVDVDAITSNESYRELTKHVPKVVIGKDIAPGANELIAEGGLNYVSPINKELMEKVAAQVNAKLLVTIEYTGSYSMNAGIGIGNLSAGAAKMNLKASLTMYEKGKGIVMQKTFTQKSDESFPMVQGIMISDNYAKGLSSAHNKMLPEIKAYLLDSQAKAKAAGTKS
ncbi:MAG: hypothetical protein JW915_17825 [Chitinispirillaceae bacterium]|nr:hypothetical protein [Chitinispirillaceae bacterium]